jgi:UDP-GlcNAc:undecaprenyl-phosphate GlcNAc-1-phosphate transferase
MHFHHRLLALGLDHHEAVIVIYAVQCLLLLLAWQMRFENDLLIVATFLGFAVLVTGSFMLLERAGWRWRAVAAPSHSPLAQLRVWLVARQRLPRWSMRVAWLCAVVYLLGIALYANPVPMDIGWLGALGLLALGLGALWRQSAFAATWLVRGALYVAVMVAVYLDHVTTMHAPPPLRAAKWVFLPLLALAVAVAMRLSGSRRFEATPLDLLLIFGALALPNLPGLVSAPSNLGFSVATLVVLCYAVEMIAALGSRLKAALLGAIGTFYLLITVRVWLT